MNNMNLFSVWNQVLSRENVLWNWSRFMVVYSPFFRQRHVRQFLFNTKFHLEDLIFRFVKFFSIYGNRVYKNLSTDYCVTGKCSKHRRTTVRFRMNRREQRIGIFWEFRLREKTADTRRVYLFDCCLTRDVNVMADLRVVLSWMSTCQLMY